MHHKAIWPLEKRSKRAFQGFPLATIAFYGPNDQRASKVAVDIVPAEGAEASALERWFSEEGDVRSDLAIAQAISEFIEAQGARSVVLGERILGCPHEEGTDYPEGTACPRCPFWAERDRWAGSLRG